MLCGPRVLGAMTAAALVAACTSTSAGLSVREACRELSRRTMTSRPVDVVPPPFDAEAKAVGRVARDLAGETANASFRRALEQLADVSTSSYWASQADWLAAPAVARVHARCDRELGDRSPPPVG